MSLRFGLFLLLAGSLHGAVFLLSHGAVTPPELHMARGRMSIALRSEASPKARREVADERRLRPEEPAPHREDPPPELDREELPEKEPPEVETRTESRQEAPGEEPPGEPSETVATPPPDPHRPEETSPETTAPDDRGELEEPVPDPRNPKPDYPRIARRRVLEGTVELRLLVLPDGRVGEVEVVRSSGHRVLDEAAAEAAQGYRFTPARRNGQTVDEWTTQPFEFRLD